MGATLAIVLMLAMAGVPLEPPQGANPQRPNQQRGRGGELPNPGPGLPIQQLQAMFDAYALVQAQRVLQLTDEQYQQFFPRMNRLQDARRAQIQQRNRLLNELRRLFGPAGGDEAAIGAALKRYEDAEVKAAQDVAAARQAVDEGLTIRQRAAFRFFEEDMERQKIDFITRARQGQGRQGGVPRLQ